MNIRLIKKLDAVVGYIGTSTFPAPVRLKLSSPATSLLLIRPGGIGDAVMLAPAIRTLKRINPKVHISILAERRNKGIFPLIPGVDNVLCYDRFSEFLQALRGRYDVVIDTEQWHRLSAVVARLVRAPLKIGFDTNNRRRMFTHPVPYSQDDYEADSFSHLLNFLGIEMESVEMGSPFLSLPAAASVKATGLLGLLNDKQFVVVFPGASTPVRHWGADHFRQVAEVLSASGVNIVVVGGKEDFQQGEVIAGEGLGLNLSGLASLSETAAVIQKSALLVSGDSGVLHIAVGLGVPTVSLFGPGRAKKWAPPQGDQHIVINKELPCSPCTVFGTMPPCPIGVKCMRDITVNDVVNAVTILLARPKHYSKATR